MDREETLSMIDAIGTCEDEAERKRMLNAMRDTVGAVYDQNETLARDNEEYKKANNALREVNNDFYLQLGQRKTNRQIIEGQLGEDPEPPEPRKFENLFDEKGDIK